MKITDEIRNYLAALYDCDPAEDIYTNRQAVHVYGTIPNTNDTGWFYAGDLSDLQCEMEREDAYRKEVDASE